MASYQYTFVIDDLSKSWPGGKELFSNINLSFLPNAKIGVVGINGSGKSTFLKIMAGHEKDYTGEVSKWLDEGATIIAGCCRTRPSHIKHMVQNLIN